MEEKSNQTLYEKNVKSRSTWHYYKGLVARWKQHFKYARAVRIARKKGATIGEGVIMPLSLAKKANKNLMIGNHVSIQTDDISLRRPITIGNHVIIGTGVSILTGTHCIDSLEWENYGSSLVIEDYVWLATKSLILPMCEYIHYGAVVGAGAVVTKNVSPMSVVGGNPAIELRKRKCVHENLVIESLLGGDYKIYRETRKDKKCEK